MRRFTANIEMLNKIDIFLTKYWPFIKKIARFSCIILIVIFIWCFRDSILYSIKKSCTIGWFFFLLPLLFLIWNAIATKAWSKLLLSTSNKNSGNFWNLFLIRIQGQALNTILPLFGMGGEVLRSTKTIGELGLKNSITCVAIDKLVDIFAETSLAVVGLIFLSSLLPYSSITLPVSVVLLLSILSIVVFWESIWPRLIKKCSFRSCKDLVATVGSNKQLCSSARIALVYHFLEHVLMGGEIMLISCLLGVNLDLRQILIINSVSSLFNLLFIFIPGRIGAYECSLAFAFNLLSFPSTTGVSVALIRRGRQFLVCLAGVFLTIVHKKKNTADSSFKGSISIAEVQN
jgi:hypothetical protein